MNNEQWQALYLLQVIWRLYEQYGRPASDELAASLWQVSGILDVPEAEEVYGRFNAWKCRVTASP